MLGAPLWSLTFQLQWGNWAKWNLIITFDWAVLLIQSQCDWSAFCMILSGIPIWPITPNSVSAALFEPNKARGVSLKRSCKIQLRRIDFGSMRPPKCYDPFWPNFTIVIEKLRLAIEKNYVNKAICSGRWLGCWVSQVSQVYRTKKEETSMVLDQSIADMSSPLSKLSKTQVLVSSQEKSWPKTKCFVTGNVTMHQNCDILLFSIF